MVQTGAVEKCGLMTGLTTNLKMVYETALEDSSSAPESLKYMVIGQEANKK